MPTYEYKCQQCKTIRTEYYTMAEKPKNPPTCYTCNEMMVESYSSPVVLFNSSGFYSTDKKGK